MSKYCPLCGSELVNEVCPNIDTHFKPMCLNCESCKIDEDGNTYRCYSEVNMNNAIKKIKDALPDFGYDVVQLKPLPIKKPSLKCSIWSPDTDLIKATMMSFVVAKQNGKKSNVETKTE